MKLFEWVYEKKSYIHVKGEPAAFLVKAQTGGAIKKPKDSTHFLLWDLIFLKVEHM